jgi:hypothetical protein
MKKSKMSAETLKEAESYGLVMDDGKILIKHGPFGRTELVTLEEMRRRKSYWNRVAKGKEIA